MRRPRPTTLARWCLTCLTAFLVAAWSLSSSWQLRWAGFARSTYYTGESALGLLHLTLARPLGNVGWTIGWDLRPMPPAYMAGVPIPPPKPTLSAWWGEWTTTTTPTVRRDELTIPYWLFTTPLALAATLTWLPLLTRARRKPGLCPTCTYDRRGLTPNTPCPECGTLEGPEGAKGRVATGEGRRHGDRNPWWRQIHAAPDGAGEVPATDPTHTSGAQAALRTSTTEPRPQTG